MTLPESYTFINQTQNDVALDAKFNEDISLRRTLPAGGSLTVTGSELPIGVDAVGNNPQIRQLIADGFMRVELAGGPMISKSYEIAADAGTSAAAVSLDGNFPFDLLLTGAVLEVPTGVASSTLTLSDAASAGNDYSAAEDTDGTPAVVDATLQATRLVPAGSQLFGLQSATAKPAVTITLFGIRKSL